MSHLGPGKETLAERLQSAGYVYAQTAENLASGSADAARIVSLWQASPGHHLNMMNPAYSEAGIGQSDSHNVNYWVLIFARPADP